MAHRIFTSALALAASAMAFSPAATAQLLGGSGGLGGGLGGTLGGTLGNPTGPIGGTLGTAGDITGSGRGETHVDRRSGRVQGKGSADANGKGSANGNADLLGSPIGVALALDAARAAVDLGVAATRAGDVARGPEGAADRPGRIAKRAAQRSAKATTKSAAAAEQLRRGRGRKCHGRRGERESRGENTMCHCPSPSSCGPEGRA